MHTSWANSSLDEWTASVLLGGSIGQLPRMNTNCPINVNRRMGQCEIGMPLLYWGSGRVCVNVWNENHHFLECFANQLPYRGGGYLPGGR